MTLADEVSTIVARRVSEAESMLKAITGRAHAPEPGDAERAVMALDTLALSHHPFTSSEFATDCWTAVDVRARKAKLDADLAALEQLDTEERRLQEAMLKSKAEPIIINDPESRDRNLRLAEITQRYKHLIGQAEAERQKIRELLGQHPRVFAALTAAGLDLRLG